MDAHTVFIQEKKVLDKNPEQKNHDVHPFIFFRRLTIRNVKYHGTQIQ